MKHPKTFIFILLIIFIILFGIYLLRPDYKIIESASLLPMDKEMEENLKNKKMMDCKKTCKQEICDEYVKKQIEYDLCKECSKEFKCYDPYKRKCVFCLNFQSCENMYGCGDMKPVNPGQNYCDKCWSEVTY